MKKYSYLICALFLNGTIALAQSTPVQNRQLSSGVVGIAPGQTARWNVLYPTAPAPILQPICSVDLSVADDQGNSLKTTSVSQFTAGRSVSVDLNSDTDLTGKPRTQIHAYAVAPDGCNLTATLELIDNTNQKTVLVVGSNRPIRWSVHHRQARWNRDTGRISDDTRRPSDPGVTLMSRLRVLQRMR
jgi:hypothetical protein